MRHESSSPFTTLRCTLAWAFAVTMAGGTASAQQSTSGPERAYRPLLLEKPGTAFREPEMAFLEASRLVDVDFDVLYDLAAQGTGEVRIPLLDGIEVVADFSKPHDLGIQRMGFSGRLEDEEISYVALVFSEESLVATVNSLRRGRYQIRSTRTGEHAVFRLANSLGVSCRACPSVNVPLRQVFSQSPGADPRSGAETFGGPRETAGIGSILAGESGGAYAAAPDDGSLIDLGIVFTTNAQNAAGGYGPMNNLCALAVVECNDALAISNVSTRVRLVGCWRIAYDDSTKTQEEILDDLTFNSSLSAARALREASGADCLAMFENGANGSDGTAFLYNGNGARATSVTYWGLATGAYVAAHQLGHNWGCGHDAYSGDGYFSFSHGWFFTLGGTVGTIMSELGAIIPHYSNPDVRYSGIITGSSEADNARTIDALRQDVAAFRTTVNYETGILVSFKVQDDPQRVTVERGDVARVDYNTGTLSIEVDISDVIPGDPQLSGFHRAADGSYYMAFDGPLTIPGLTGGPAGEEVEGQDIVRFVPTSLGTNTAGSFGFFFDGSDVELTLDNQEKIDAISFDEDGDLLVSVKGPWTIGALSGKDEDVIEFVIISSGANTVAAASIFWDGSQGDGKLSSPGEDVDALHVFVNSTGTGADDMAFSTTGEWRVPDNQSGNSKDLCIFYAESLGTSPVGDYGKATALRQFGIKGSTNVDGMYVLY